MSEYSSLNSTEYVYDQKNEGAVKVKRTLMVCGYVLFLLGFFIFCMVTKIFPLFAIGPLALYILILCTWRLVKFDCYWDFSTGMLEIGKIKVNKNGRRKSPRVKIHIKEAERIGHLISLRELGEIDKLYDYSESPSSEKRIFIIFREGGKRACAIVEATDRLAALMVSFCQNADPEMKKVKFH